MSDRSHGNEIVALLLARKRSGRMLWRARNSRGTFFTGNRGRVFFGKIYENNIIGSSDLLRGLSFCVRMQGMRREKSFVFF